MKRSRPTIAWLVLIGGLASCGGPPKPAATPQPAPCAAMAAHVGSTVSVDEGKAIIEKIMVESCESDGWSKETIDCMSTEPFQLLVSASETPFGRCNALMTDAQRDGISRRFAAEVDKARGTPEVKPETQEMELPPPPPPPPPPKKK